MKKPEKHDIFISYRRNSADGTARLVYDWLVDDGYSVAFDLETLHSGNFDEQILDTIRNCSDFIVILSPDALQRCMNPYDWVRREIACAIESGVNIVPVMLRGFSFPHPYMLPKDIRELARRQAVDASAMKRFDGTVKELESYLKARPRRRVARRVAIGLAAAAAALAAALFVAGRRAF